MAKYERLSRGGKSYKQRARTRANQEGSVYQRKRDGRWVTAVSLPDGRRKEWTFDTQQAAKEKLEIVRDEMRHGAVPDPARLLLGDYLAEWLSRHQAKKTLRRKTIETYEYLIRVHVVPAVGRIPLDNLQTAHLARFIAQKCTEPSAKDPSKPWRPARWCRSTPFSAGRSSRPCVRGDSRSIPPRPSLHHVSSETR